MEPHAILRPEFPASLLVGSVPRPPSSMRSCRTTERLIIVSLPTIVKNFDSFSVEICPFFVIKFPKSPL